MKTTVLAAIFALSIQQAFADEPMFMKVLPDPEQLHGDGSTWEMNVNIKYKDKKGQFHNKPVYTLKTTSGKCAYGREQTLDMKGTFKVKVADQFCVGIEKGDLVIGAWMTSPYPDDADDWPTQDEAHFVYGERAEVSADQSTTKIKTSAGVFVYTVRKL